MVVTKTPKLDRETIMKQSNRANTIAKTTNAPPKIANAIAEIKNASPKTANGCTRSIDAHPKAANGIEFVSVALLIRDKCDQLVLELARELLRSELLLSQVAE